MLKQTIELAQRPTGITSRGDLACIGIEAKACSTLESI